MPFKQIQEKLKKELSAELYAHSTGVAETAAKLAHGLGVEESRARLAGLLHDCARGWTGHELVKYVRAHGMEADKFSLAQPVLLHAPVGAALAENWGISDREILSAIRNHTLGYPGMTLLEQIIYVADKIEPGRTYPGIEGLRATAFAHFHEGLMLAAAGSINYTLSKQQAIHPHTIAFWNWMVERYGKGTCV